MIVDDDREIRDVLRILLTGEGFEVAEAAGGEEALGYLENHAQDVDLVILDVIRTVCPFTQTDAGRGPEVP